MKLSSWLFIILLCIHIFSGVASAEQGVLVVKVRNPRGQPLSGVVVGPTGIGNPGRTDGNGLARISLPAGTRPTDSLLIEIVSPRHKYIFISPWDQRLVIPSFEDKPENFVSLTLGLPGDRELLLNDEAIRAMASSINKLLASNGSSEVTPELRHAALVQVATIFGIPGLDIDKTIRSWGEKVQDPYDIGIAALYEGNYLHAQQQLQIASDNREQDLQLSIKKYADSKFFLGQSLYLQGKYQAAADAFRETVKWRSDDPLVVNNLALNLAQLGNLNEAERLYRQSADSQRAVQNRDPFLFSQSIGSLGGVLLREGNLTDAEPALREALSIRQQSLPSGDPRVATSMNNLAVLLQLKGKLNEAEKLLTDALAIQEEGARTRRRCLAPSATQTTATITCDSLIAGSRGALVGEPPQSALEGGANSATTSNSTMAVDLTEKGIIGLGSVAQERPGISSTMCNLALLYVARKEKLNEAELLVHRAIQAQEQSLPKGHPDLAISFEALGKVLTAEGSFKNAENAFESARDIVLLNFGPQHIYLAEIYESLSIIEARNNLAGAREDLRRALAIEKYVWGDSDARTQATEHRLEKLSAN
jgi:tetratricopeptide (TPR) repeat protein